MANLYLTEQGSSLKKSGERLIVEKEGQELLEIQCFKVDTVMVFGNIQITTQAVSEILEHGINLAFLTMSGKLKGQVTPHKGKNIDLRLKQFNCHQDEEFAVRVARAVVAGKVRNSIEVMRRFLYNHPEADLRGEIDQMEQILSEVPEKIERERIVGLEGAASRMYFQGFAKMCLKNLEFPGRRRRPPTDPINALLSLGYTIVLYEIQALLEAVGLDPYFGFLHKLEYGRPSLALDLLEEFRQPVVDRLVLTLTNKQVLVSEDFESDEETGGVRLKQESFKKFIRQYEDWLKEEFSFPELEGKKSFRQVFRMQVEALARSVRTGGDQYRPFRYGV